MRSDARSERDAASVAARARFEDLYDRHFSVVSGYVQRRVRPDRVDDVLAETFLTVWRRIDDVPDGEAARWWLLRVAYRVVGHQWRGASRRDRLEARLAAMPMATSPSPEGEAVDADELRRVLEASAHLSPRDAEILRLASWEGLERDEIAQVLDISPSVVSQRVHRARARLTKLYTRLESRRDRSPAAQKGGTP